MMSYKVPFDYFNITLRLADNLLRFNVVGIVVLLVDSVNNWLPFPKVLILF